MREALRRQDGGLTIERVLCSLYPYASLETGFVSESDVHRQEVLALLSDTSSFV